MSKGGGGGELQFPEPEIKRTKIGGAYLVISSKMNLIAGTSSRLSFLAEGLQKGLKP